VRDLLEVQIKGEETLNSVSMGTIMLTLIHFLYIYIYIYIYIYSFSILSDDRSNASSKTVPPHSAI
jgi:hypothetical protein